MTWEKKKKISVKILQQGPLAWREAEKKNQEAERGRGHFL
jgi:hypothetical protein